MDWNPNTASQTSGPRATRVSRLLPIEIGSERLGRQKVVIRNIAPYGLGARGDVELLACERLTVYLPDGHEIGATVRWVRKNTFGLALDEPINPAVFQPKGAAVATTLVAKDADLGFVPIQIKATIQRPGFQKSHRDQILDGSSLWVRD